MTSRLPVGWLLGLLLCACQGGGRVYTHPHALYHVDDSGIQYAPPPPGSDCHHNACLPFVEVYRHDPAGVFSVARVWGFTEDEAMANAKRTARAIR